MDPRACSRIGARHTIFGPAAEPQARLALHSLGYPSADDATEPHLPAGRVRAGGVWRATGEGLRSVWRDRLLRTLTLLSVAIAALYLPVEGVILPAQFVADATPERLGLVVMAMSAGGLAGALGFGAVGHRLHRLAAFITAVLGSCTALLAMATLRHSPCWWRWPPLSVCSTGRLARWSTSRCRFALPSVCAAAWSGS